MRPAEMSVIRILEDDLTSGEMIALIVDHLTHLRQLAPDSPPESHHALSVDDLRHNDITLWGAWQEQTLVGCVALKTLDGQHGEIKSMRTASGFERQGIASQMLEYLIAAARRRGLQRLSLETGSQPGFAAARAFYERHGFRCCAPFADYVDDPNSVYMTMVLFDRRTTQAEAET